MRRSTVTISNSLCRVCLARDLRTLYTGEENKVQRTAER